MPAFETPEVHCQTIAEAEANRLIDNILREEGRSHQHLAPSHLECLGTTCFRAPSGVQFLGMTQFCCCEFGVPFLGHNSLVQGCTVLACPSGFVCPLFWARP
jgi:hypothetical protein